jgi:hypothetical protein
MARRRQETERQLGGSLENPMGMQSRANLRPAAPQVVTGVQNVNAPPARVDDTGLQVLNGLAEFGSRKIREAAKTRYEKLMLDGAMAYQQGKSIDELELDGNKWMLEGYQTMEAETVSSALYAAQQAEITNGLYESDPNAFRQRYTSRLEEALSGKDERTQDLIKTKMAQQMPALVEQHTREHAAFLERKNVEALATSVDVISRDPTNTQRLLDFAMGTAPEAQGLGEEKRRAAVVDGVVRAYTNNNPIAFQILDQAGALESMNPQELNAIRAAQASYESRKRSERDDAFLLAEQGLIERIQQGDVNPEEAINAYGKLMLDHGMTMTMGESATVYGQARGANALHAQSIALEVEAAKLNGDADKVAELTYNYAQTAANPATPGRVYDYTIPVQYSMGPKRPNKPRNEIVSVIASAAEEVLGPNGKVVITSGMEDPGEQHGANRHKTGNAADVAFYRADGSKVKASDPEAIAIAEASARRGATGIGFGEEYMGGEHMHIDLVGTSGGGGNVWASGAKANADRLVATMQNATKGTALGDIDPEKWRTVVKQFGGDVELAAVAYTMGSEAARGWDETGRRTADLDPDVAGFVDRIGGQLEGRAYQTAETRVAQAQRTLEIARERAAVDVYSAMGPQLADLDRRYVAGDIDESTYNTQRNSIMANYGVARTMADVDHVISQADARYANAQTIAKTIQDQQYAVNLDLFAGRRYEADKALEAAVKSIGSMVKPPGATDEEFKAAQEGAIQLAMSEYQSFLGNQIADLGIQPQHSGVGDTITKIVDATSNAAIKAQENRMLNAKAERAIATGTLSSAGADVQDMAWKQAQAGIKAEAEQYAATIQADQNMSGAEKMDAMAAFEKQKYEEFFARSNFVPDSMRTEASAVLTGKIVQDDGTVSQNAIDTILAYRDLKGRSSTAANQLLDDQSRAVAEGALLLSGGNEQALPRVLQDLWAKGLGNPLMGKPDPIFAERGEVTAAIRDTIGGGRFWRTVGRIFGGQASADTMDLTEGDNKLVRDMLQAQVQRLHNVNPRLDPKAVAAMAEQSVVRSMAPLDTDLTGHANIIFAGTQGTGGRSGLFDTLGYYTGGFGNNKLIYDPSGADMFESFFSGRADQYAQDRRSITKAISGYVQSPEFKQKHFDATPSVGMLTYMVESLPFVSDELSTAQAMGKPVFDILSVGDGQVYFNFTLDENGTEIPLAVPMSEIGAWYMQQDIANITK